jgi:aromatic-L-amino-acid decarboxylase
MQTDQTHSPLHIPKDTFRTIGHWLVDQISDHFDSLPNKRVARGSDPSEVRKALGRDTLPDHGQAPEEIIRRATTLLMDQSLFPGHPKFWGYIVGSGTEIGTLADLLAAAVNPNVGGWDLAPMASEMERQVVSWTADWIGYPGTSDGLLVSGGAMANYVGFLVGRRIKAPWEVRTKGLHQGAGQFKVYCSKETHTWIQKATDLFGLGTDAIEWLPTDSQLRIDVAALEERIRKDKANADIPLMVIGTAGTVGTGAVDDLKSLRDICRRHDLWFHVDGAYGAPAAHLPENAELFAGLTDADSVALDPHKWFYTPQEAGCVLVKERKHLLDTFSYRPPYFLFEESEEEPTINYYEYGLQNSRGFRALKVWMTLLQAGDMGLTELIRHDITMAGLLYQLVDQAPDFEAFQTHLSITTFRYLPDDSLPKEELNEFNKKLMVALQKSGHAFVSHTVVDGTFLLRACIVNFRTTEDDIRALPGILRTVAEGLG